MKSHRPAIVAMIVLGVAFVAVTLSGLRPSRAGGAAGGDGAAAEAGKHYVCAPCGLPCDGEVYDKPGVCPKCGMALVEQGAAAAASQSRKKVGILVFNGVEIIDYTGPYEMFGAAGFDVYTVAESKDPVTTAMGMMVVPKYTFTDAPAPDVLVVPGGGIHPAMESAATLQWVKDTTAHAAHTLSVCNGAFILARAGLLNGLSATTTASNIDKLRSEYPKIHVVEDRRVVDNGRILTAGGLSSGIDGALQVLSAMIGRGETQKVALGEEYDWRPGEGFARAALADRLIPEVDLDGFGSWSIVSTQGNARQWEIVARGTSTLTAGEITDRFGEALASKGKWSKVAPSGGVPTTRRWTFAGRRGEAWTGMLTLRASTDAKDEYTATLIIARAG
jgi:putative intracellular protease/amidase